MRFTLIDTVVDKQPDCVIAVKSVTNAEEYLGDHFPSFPVLPGVMMLEAMVQTARQMLPATLDGATAHVPGAGWVLAEVRNVRYGNMVRPGQQLRLTVERLKAEGDRHTFQGRGTVDDNPAVQGRFVLRKMK